MSYRTITAALALAALIAPAVARGDEDPRLARVQPIAAAAWPTVSQSCPAGVIVEVGEITDPDHKAAEARPPCTVRFKPNYRTYSRAYTCILMVHEYGHLAGQEHVTDPHAVMYDGDTLDVYAWPACGAIADQEDRLDLAQTRAWETQHLVRNAQRALKRTHSLRRKRHLRRVIRHRRTQLVRFTYQVTTATASVGP
jgi:hypothetical protein